LRTFLNKNQKQSKMSIEDEDICDWGCATWVCDASGGTTSGSATDRAALVCAALYRSALDRSATSGAALDHCAFDRCAWDRCAWEGIYHENFPQEWAVNHEPGTGPEECKNCAYFGCIEDVFIGYCANCAIYVYEGSRGPGFIDVGVEFKDDNAIDDNESIDHNESIHHNEINDNDSIEPYDNTETSVFDCHFEGGYNDF